VAGIKEWIGGEVGGRGTREKGFRSHAFGPVSQVTPFLQS